jgi:hypothetical protein
MERYIAKLEHLALETIKKLPTIDYEELILMIEQRECVLNKMRKTPITLEDKRKYGSRIQKLGILEHEIVNRMGELKQEAADFIQKVKESERQKKSYEQMEYGKDMYLKQSVFFDTKK